MSASVKAEILDRLDIRAEYEALGIEFTSATPNQKGWLECRSFRSDDANPSAGVNVDRASKQYGVYNEFNGNRNSLSFFDFLIDIGKAKDFKDAIGQYAKKFSLETRGRPKRTPQTAIEKTKWRERTVRIWCDGKSGIDYEAIQPCGAFSARYPSKPKRDESQNTVIGFPIHGADGTETGFVCYNTNGKELPVYQGNGQDPKMVKIKTIEGSTSGWVGSLGVKTLESADVVWKVEGVSDMLAVVSLLIQSADDMKRHAVLTNAGGCQEVLPPAFVKMLTGKKVIVVGDADKPGQSGANKWLNALARIAAELYRPLLPYVIEPKHGKDIRDFIGENGHSYESLLAWATAETVKPNLPLDEPETDEGNIDRAREVCESLGIDVLGELPDNSIELFSAFHGKVTVIPSAKSINYELLLQICGPVGKKINLNNEVNISGAHQLQSIKNAVALCAGFNKIDQNDKIGLGCWFGTDAKGHESNSIVCVGGNEAFVWDGETVGRIKTPRHGGQILDLQNTGVWYGGFDDIGKLMAETQDAKWCADVARELIGLFSNWSWQNAESPKIIAGLVFASWIQTLWTWRPLVGLTGPSDAGKSTLLECLEDIFGLLAFKSSKSSEAGLRQHLRNNATVIMCDEFESDQHRQRILELLRTSSRGDKKYMGTADQSGVGYGLKHIPWVAAIEIGLEREPDINRFVMLELQRPSGNRRGNLDWMPGSVELRELGHKTFAVALRYARDAIALANKLRSHRIEGVNGRVVESFAVPVAMLATILGEQQPEMLLESVLKSDGADTTMVSDEEELLSSIFSSTVDLGPEGRPTVGHLLSYPNDGKYTRGNEGLEKSGLGVVETKSGKVLFVAHKVVRRMLLGDTNWKSQNIQTLLKRIPGAESSRQRISGQIPRGVSVPWDYVEGTFLGDDDFGADTSEEGRLANEDKDWFRPDAEIG